MCCNLVTEDLKILLGPVIMREYHAAGHVQCSKQLIVAEYDLILQLDVLLHKVFRFPRSLILK